MPTRTDRYSKVSGPVAHELSALPLRFLLERSVLASRGALSLFTELPRSGLLGNPVSGVQGSQKPSFRHRRFAETQRFWRTRKRLGLLNEASALFATVRLS